jgi:hypothetical protein
MRFCISLEICEHKARARLAIVDLVPNLRRQSYSQGGCLSIDLVSGAAATVVSALVSAAVVIAVVNWGSGKLASGGNGNQISDDRVMFLFGFDLCALKETLLPCSKEKKFIWV